MAGTVDLGFGYTVHVGSGDRCRRPTEGRHVRPDTGRVCARSVARPTGQRARPLVDTAPCRSLASPHPVSAMHYVVRSGVACWVVSAMACARVQRSPMDDNFPVIRVTPDTVTLVRRPNGAGFYVTAIVRNATGKPFLAQVTCGRSAQRLIDGRWTTVWTPVCVSGAGTVASLPARDSLVVDVNVFGFTDPAYAPRLDPRLQAGLYRVAFLVGVEVGHSGTRSGVHEVASAPFVVVESTTR